MKCDFGGYATKCDVRCDDGRVIKRDAFVNDDGKQVPLVWNHNHKTIDGVLGHAILENRNDGVYAYCFLNDSPSGKTAREAIKHGDIKCLSIFANQIRQTGPEVVHGKIHEVSMVIGGCNPKAKIDDVANAEVVVHSDLYEDDAAVIWCGSSIDQSKDFIEHASDDSDDKDEDESDGETYKDIFDTLTEKQKNVVYQMIGVAIDSANKAKSTADDSVAQSAINDEEDNYMSHNIFDQNSTVNEKDTAISESEMSAIIADGKRYGSLRESCIQHGVENIVSVGNRGGILQHGITGIEQLFPDEKSIDRVPSFIKRETGWVSTVMNGVRRSAFSRVKSMFADLREDEARAKGYMKTKLKKEEVFSLLKRVTNPQTIYKKQKIDRDDVIDITDFDVVAWIKGEMRIMLDEEIARAILIGDGRLASSDDKIKEDCIRPIAKDEELYTIHQTVDGTGDELAKNFIRQAILARIKYQGSGNPDLFTTEEMLANMLLLTDATGRDLYTDVGALARKLRIRNIVTVPVMDGGNIYGIIVNLNDYNVGADRGGAVTMFDDFDIDYNAQKYLIETRCSGALIRPFSAISLEKASAGA